MWPLREIWPGVRYGSVTEVTCSARANGASAASTRARVAGADSGALESIASVRLSPGGVREVLVQQRLPRVAAAGVVLRRGAEVDPQGDQAGHAGQPGEQRDPAVPVARAAEQANRPRADIRGVGARRAALVAYDMRFSCEPEELLLSLSMLARSGARIVVRREALGRAGTRREYSARSTAADASGARRGAGDPCPEHRSAARQQIGEDIAGIKRTLAGNAAPLRPGGKRRPAGLVSNTWPRGTAAGQWASNTGRPNQTGWNDHA
jgi:hypothetical protein